MNYELLHRNLELEAELVRVVQRLRTDGVSVVVLKGVPLARRLNISLAERRIGDLDLLVPAQHATAAMACLERLGYSRPRFRDVSRAIDAALPVQLKCVRDRQRFDIDLHWSAFTEFFPLPPKTQLENVVAITVRNVEIPVFAPALALTHLVTEFAKDGYLNGRIASDLNLAIPLWSLDGEVARFVSSAEASVALAHTQSVLKALGFESSLGPTPFLSARQRAQLALVNRLMTPDRAARRIRGAIQPSRMLIRRQRLAALASGVPTKGLRSGLRWLMPPSDELSEQLQREAGWSDRLARLLRA